MGASIFEVARRDNFLARAHGRARIKGAVVGWPGTHRAAGRFSPAHFDQEPGTEIEGGLGRSVSTTWAGARLQDS